MSAMRSKVPDTLKITAEQVMIDSVEPRLFIWAVAIESDTGIWYESFGTESEKDVFLRGIKAAFEIAGRPDLNRLPIKTVYWKDR